MSGFHTATICADCEPPVVATSTGHGSRCPRCGQVETWSLLTTDALDTHLDGVLARQIIADTAIRSDGDARLLGELARRLLDRAGKRAGDATDVADPDGDFWAQPDDDEAHEASEREGAGRHEGETMAKILTHQELDDLERHLDDETQWETVNEFWDVWGPRVSDRLRRLIATARTGAEWPGQDRLRARVDQLEKALGEALDIAEWEASEYTGKREHLTRMPQLRDVLAGKATQS